MSIVPNGLKYNHMQDLICSNNDFVCVAVSDFGVSGGRFVTTTTTTLPREGTYMVENWYTSVTSQAGLEGNRLLASAGNCKKKVRTL